MKTTVDCPGVEAQDLPAPSPGSIAVGVEIRKWRRLTTALRRPGVGDSVVVNPDADLGRVEADEAPDFDVRNSAFGDEPAHMADTGTEEIRKLVDGE